VEKPVRKKRVSPVVVDDIVIPEEPAKKDNSNIKIIIILGIIVSILFIVLLNILLRKDTASGGNFDEAKAAYEKLIEKNNDQLRLDSVSILYHKNRSDSFEKLKDHYLVQANKNIQFYKDNEKKFRNIPNTVKPIKDLDSLRAAIQPRY